MKYEKEKDGYPVFYAEDIRAWRNWLTVNHIQESSVWLIIFHKDSQTPSIKYEDAVDHALCYGWIDSKPNKRDSESYYQYFAQRNPKSNWSKINKRRIRKMEQAGLMTAAGHKMVAVAKETGTWDALNEVEAGVIPKDMQSLFDKDQTAYENFQAFPFSVRRGILEWIFNAKRPATRQKRIKETVEKAAKNIRANQYRA